MLPDLEALMCLVGDMGTLQQFCSQAESAPARLRATRTFGRRADCQLLWREISQRETCYCSTKTEHYGRTPLPTDTPIPSETTLPTVTPEGDIGFTWVRPKGGMIMIYVPKGVFTMGSDLGKLDEQPVHDIYLDAFWIDQTEVTYTMELCGKIGDDIQNINKFEELRCCSPYIPRKFDHDPCPH
jgi:hypothetical protein